MDSEKDLDYYVNKVTKFTPLYSMSVAIVVVAYMVVEFLKEKK